MSVLRLLMVLCFVLVSGRAAAEGPYPTLPADTVLHRIVFGSCADQGKPQPFWEPILAARPQLFLMIGDNVYGDVSSAEMAELKEAYAALAAEPGFQRLRATTPVLATWDDHDYGENDAGGDFPYRRQSEALFRDFWGLPPAAEDGDGGIHRAVTVGPPGQRVQVILLDTRSFRSPLRPTDARGAPGRERYLPDPDPAKTMLGEAQWRWLAATLREPAEVRLLVSSIQVLADGHGWERWGNLPRERQRLFDTLAEAGASGVVILSGDRHLGALYRRVDVLPYPLYEITSSSFNRPFRNAREAGPHRLGDVYGDENFGVIDIDWQAGTMSLEVRGLDGAVVRRQQIRLADLR